MYLRTPEAMNLAAPAVTSVSLNEAPIAYGDDEIRESDTQKILNIISGPPYQAYIHPVMATQVNPKLPTRFLRIVSSRQQVPAHLRGRFVRYRDKMVGGTIDRANGTIWLLATAGRGASRLEVAIHETVHLFAHPFMSLVDDKIFQSKYGTICIRMADVGSFQRKYCDGFGEGATQVITEQIMKAQNIKKSSEEIYKDFVPPVLKLISIFGIERFARAYFWGAINELTEAMEFRWGGGWRTVSQYTYDRNPKKALDLIDKLEWEYIKRRGPKGDYPTLPPSKRYA